MLTAVLPAPTPAPDSRIHVPPVGWLPPTGIMPGAVVAVETPGGVLRGRVIAADLEQSFSRPDISLFDTLDNVPFLAGGPAAGMTAPVARPGFVRPEWNTNRLNLRVRLDADGLADPGGLDARHDIARRAIERMEQLQAERLGREMAVMGGAGVETTYTTAAAAAADATVYGTAGGLWAPLSTTPARWNTYTTNNGTADWGDVNLAELTATVSRLRAASAASATSSATVGTRLWYGDTGSLYTVDATEWAWEASPTWMDVRMTARYTEGFATAGGFFLASGDSDESHYKPKTAADRLREMIRDRMAPAALGRARDPNVNPVRPGLRPTDDFRELRARETLAKIVGEDKFRRFVRDGFVTCRAKSGKTYQIFPGGGFTRVYENGKELSRLCVVLRGGFPPTDSVIVRYLMILNNEKGFCDLAVNQGEGGRGRPQVRDERPLAEVYADLKRTHALKGWARVERAVTQTATAAEPAVAMAAAG